MIRRPPRSTLFPTRRSSDLGRLVDRLGGVRRRDVGLGQGDTVVAAEIGRPALGAVGGIACGPSKVGVLIDELMGGDGVGGLGSGIALDQEKIPGSAVDCGAR